MSTILTSLNLLGGLAIFLFGMKIMSDGLQKASGERMRQLLGIATANRFAATACGTLVTSIIQSSSATTVMVVGFASAGLLTLHQSLGVIFGANIGTTMTAWIVSLFGFKMQISLFALPVIAIGFFAQFLPRLTLVRRIGETMVGFGLLFLGLDIMKNAIPADFAQNPQVVAWISRFQPDNLANLLILIFSGTVLTVILQSSSAVMAMTLTCAAAGIIDFPTSCALVLGENIGTTITANLAAIGASKTAKRAALGHFLFNIIGVFWVVCIFKNFVHFIDWLVPGSPYTKETADLTAVLPYHISAFHTVFNLCNTALMLPLLNQLAKLTYVILPKSKREDKKEHELIFLSTRFTQTPELALIAVRKEVERMMSFVTKMTDKLIHAVKVDDEKLFARLIEDVKSAEQTTDVLEHKINLYLTTLTHGNLSHHAVAQAFALFDVLNSIEHMGDCGEKIARILEKFHTKQPFAQADVDDLETIAKLTKDITKRTRRVLVDFQQPTKQWQSHAEETFAQAVSEEQELNALRKRLLHDRRERINAGQEASPDSITAYADILNNFERIGDYALRVNENILGMRADEKVAAQETAAQPKVA
ncbi:MAG: Na/Pi cotransporter family protein [Elusimicrobia bacterium]|nr:Na/Pi cotransporter family protein [Elusimicrobiota bacterium]MDD7501735.1 Na/Pi cotransporter family protein [Elusimicrobiota bacterium]MDY5729385.1 Na/Pi cotransporter family protein [Elusimicrobiaceae bacterium]